MMLKTRDILIGAGVLGAMVGANYLLKLKRLSAELETLTKASIHKIGLTGLTLRIDIMMKNPSGGSVKVKYPFVKLQYQGNTFASSEVKNQDFELPKYGQKQIDPIFISLGFISLATNVPALLKEYRASGKIKITASTISTINNKLPYNKAQEITIG